MADPKLSKEIVDIPGSCTEFIGLNVTRPPFEIGCQHRLDAQAVLAHNAHKKLPDPHFSTAWLLLPPVRR